MSTGNKTAHQNQRMFVEDLVASGNATVTGALGVGALSATSLLVGGATFVAGLTAVPSMTGALTGSVDSSLSDVVTIALSTTGGATYTDAAVNLAVNTMVVDLQEQLKEIQTTINNVITMLNASGIQG